MKNLLNEQKKNMVINLIDFYLPDYNICIEYNGAQHYKPVKYWGGE
jgi:very-short-patch-repair endonuclease